MALDGQEMGVCLLGMLHAGMDEQAEDWTSSDAS